MISKFEAGAETRRLAGAALIGSGLGLGLGAFYLAAGMAGHAADYAHSRRMNEAAAAGYEAGVFASEASAPTAVAAVPAALSASAKPKAEKKAKRRSDLECLTQAVYYEARGEGANGQFAVAQVVMNRVRHPAFPKSVCGVVFQGAGRRTGCQFSFACDGSMRSRKEASAWTRARKVASRVLAGAAIAEVGAATHFHTTGVSPAWGPQMRRVSQVGMHVFYRFNPRKKPQAEVAAAPLEAGLEPAVLTAHAGDPAQELKLSPTVAEAQAAAAQPATAETPPANAPAQPAAAAKPSDAAALKTSQPADVTAS